MESCFRLTAGNGQQVLSTIAVDIHLHQLDSALPDSPGKFQFGVFCHSRPATVRVSAMTLILELCRIPGTLRQSDNQLWLSVMLQNRYGCQFPTFRLTQNGLRKRQSTILKSTDSNHSLAAA